MSSTTGEERHYHHTLRWRWVKADGSKGEWSNTIAATREPQFAKPDGQSTWYVPGPSAHRLAEVAGARVQQVDEGDVLPEGVVSIEIQLFHNRSSIPSAEAQALEEAGEYPPPPEPINER